MSNLFLFLCFIFQLNLSTNNSSLCFKFKLQISSKVWKLLENSTDLKNHHLLFHSSSHEIYTVISSMYEFPPISPLPSHHILFLFFTFPSALNSRIYAINFIIHIHLNCLFIVSEWEENFHMEHIYHFEWIKLYWLDVSTVNNERFIRICHEIYFKFLPSN